MLGEPMEIIKNEKFIFAFKKLLGIEGGYVNNKYDSGGKTNWGITEALAKKYGYNGDMKDLPPEFAMEIYYKEFWQPLNLDLLKNKLLCYECFEFSVNTGLKKTPIKILQRSFNLLNKTSKFLLVEDGVLGLKTASAINNYKFYKSLYKVMNIFQGIFYISLAEKDKMLSDNIKKHQMTEGSRKYKEFIRGWIDKRVSL